MKLAHLVAVDKYSCSMGNTIFFCSIHALEGNLSSLSNETGTVNANFSTYPNQITYKPLISVLLSAQMAVSSVRSEGKRLYNITIYRKLFPPQLVSPDLEPLKKNLTLCQKIYYCHPLGCGSLQLANLHADWVLNRRCRDRVSTWWAGQEPRGRGMTG